MKVRAFSLMLAISFVLVCFQTAPGRAETSPSVALSGVVSSVEEGPMEGVLVGAKKTGSTITITVVSDEHGQYRFPSSKLTPGQYALRIRAVGYDLASPSTVEVTAEKNTSDLKLRKAADPASQLSNAEWFASLPGTEQQKASIRNCTHCHTLERIMRSHADSDGLTKIVERMSTYPQLSFPMMVQKLVAPRVGGGEDPLEQKLDGWRKQAQYLSTVNLSSTDQWKYSFKMHPRPKGRATQVIYTEYDLPQRTRQPHDVVVDSEGNAWYASFGELILGKIDTRTGKATEYQIPRLKGNLPAGELALRFDKDQNLWMGMQFQGGIAKFDRKTETFQTWSLPPELNGDYVQINQVSPEHAQVDGEECGLQDAGTYTVLRLDLKSGKFEVFAPFAIPRPNIYDVISDAQNKRLFHCHGKRAHWTDRRQDGKDYFAEDAHGRLSAAPGHDRQPGTPVVRRKPWGSHRDARYQDGTVQGVEGSDVWDVALRCNCGQEWRGLGWRGVHGYSPTLESADRRVRGVSAAEVHEHPQGFRRQLHHAGYVLGR